MSPAGGARRRPGHVSPLVRGPAMRRPDPRRTRPPQDGRAARYGAPMRRSICSAITAASLCLLAPAAAHAAPAGTTAPAKVFFPNPVQSLRDESLTDQKDADFFSASPFLATAYKPVTLT